MRFIRYILDLPWWAGLIIFFPSNLLIPIWGIWGYILGSMGCLFGSWTFSKLINIKESIDGSAPAIVGLGIFFTTMGIFRHSYEIYPLSYETLFIVRTVVGLMSSLMAFEGFRYK